MSPRKRLRKRKRDRPSGSQATLKVGDSIVVKPGVLDPDFGVDIGGWQGRVLEGPGTDDLVLIGWDSITLQNMPTSVIEQSEEQGLGWTQMVLAAHEVELTSPRDTEEDVARITDARSRQYAWCYLGEEGKRIGQILASVSKGDDMAALHAWEGYLAEHLVFPFKAEVSEYQHKGPLQTGARVVVRGVSLVDDLYGIIVAMRVGRRRYDLPLCDLKVADEHSPNYQLVDDYSVWFANR